MLITHFVIKCRLATYWARSLKLRIRDNSIRLRLTQTEVDLVQQDGLVQGRVRFGGDDHFDYVLRSVSGAAVPEANICSNVLTVSVAETDIDHWAKSEEVSISATRPVNGDGQLHILVEKDFECLAPREGEDESDMYPNPAAGD